MYCVFCGKKIDDNSQFCEYCGSKLNDDSHDETLDTKPPKLSSVTQQSEEMGSSSPKVHSRINAKKIALGVGLCAIVAASVFVGKMFFSGDPVDNELNGLAVVNNEDSKNYSSLETQNSELSKDSDYIRESDTDQNAYQSDFKEDESVSVYTNDGNISESTEETASDLENMDSNSNNTQESTIKENYSQYGGESFPEQVHSTHNCLILGGIHAKYEHIAGIEDKRISGALAAWVVENYYTNLDRSLESIADSIKTNSTNGTTPADIGEYLSNVCRKNGIDYIYENVLIDTPSVQQPNLNRFSEIIRLNIDKLRPVIITINQNTLYGSGYDGYFVTVIGYILNGEGQIGSLVLCDPSQSTTEYSIYPLENVIDAMKDFGYLSYIY